MNVRHWIACIALLICSCVATPEGLSSPYFVEGVVESASGEPAAGVWVSGGVVVLYGPAIHARSGSLAEELFPLPPEWRFDEMIEDRAICLRIHAYPEPSVELVVVGTGEEPPPWARMAQPWREVTQ